MKPAVKFEKGKMRERKQHLRAEERE